MTNAGGPWPPPLGPGDVPSEAAPAGAATPGPFVPPAPASGEAPSGPSSRGYWFGAAIVGLSILIGVIGGAMAISRGVAASGSFGAIAVPGTGSGRLEPGTYRIVDRDRFGYGTSPRLTVFDEQGESVVLRTATSSYRTLATFTVSVEGRYEVVAAVPPRTSTYDLPSAITVERDPSEVSAAVVPSLLAAVVGGGLLFLVGLVLLIVTAVRRSRARPKQPPTPPVSPPGPGPWSQPAGWGPPGAPTPVPGTPPGWPRVPGGWGAPPPPPAPPGPAAPPNPQSPPTRPDGSTGSGWPVPGDEPHSPR